MKNMKFENIGNDVPANISSGGGYYLVDLNVSLSDVENINYKKVNSNLWFSAMDFLYIKLCHPRAGGDL
jgi:hypothetical protein